MRQVLLVGAVLALTASCVVPVSAPGWPSTGGDVTPGDGACPRTVGQQVLDAVNRARQRQGLPELTTHPALVRAAQGHTADQARRGSLSHTGSDGSSVADRVEREGYRWSRVGENVAGGQRTATDVLAGWMGSPGHRDIILTPGAGHAGVGYVHRGDHRIAHFWTLVVAVPGAGQAEPGVACHP